MILLLSSHHICCSPYVWSHISIYSLTKRFILKAPRLAFLPNICINYFSNFGVIPVDSQKTHKIWGYTSELKQSNQIIPDPVMLGMFLLYSNYLFISGKYKRISEMDVIRTLEHCCWVLNFQSTMRTFQPLRKPQIMFNLFWI